MGEVKAHHWPINRGPRVHHDPIGDPSDRHSLQAHIVEFLDWSEVRGYSESTISTRRRELERFHGWLAERGVTRTAEVTKLVMDRYQRWLFHWRKANGQPLTFLTQKNRLMPLKGFFSWATKTNRILYNPAADIEMPRVEHRLPKAVLTATEMEQVLAIPDLEDPFGLRDRAILELFYATGIRRGEMSRLVLFDLDFDRRALSVRQGKGKKDRTVPVTLRALGWIQRYLDEIRPRLVVEPDEGWLFLTFDGQPLSLAYLTHIAAKAVDAAEVGKRGACHLFRHTMATVMLEGGADIRWIQAMLGHENLQSTQIYTRVSITQLTAIVDACHPGAHRGPRQQPRPDNPTDEDQADDSQAALWEVLDGEARAEWAALEVTEPHDDDGSSSFSLDSKN